MKLKIYRNYGVLAREKVPVYTVCAPASTAVTCDEIEITLPEGFTASENAMGQPLIDTPDGKTYLADEIISQRGGEPVLMWFDGQQHFVKCNYQEV